MINPFQAIKALFQINKSINAIKEEYKMDSTQVKPGWKTTEFWGKLILQILAVVAAVKGFIPGNTAAIVIGTLEAVYTAFRSLVKIFQNKDLPELPAA